MARPKYKFDKRVQRYRFTSGDRKGQFVSQVKVRSLLQSHIDREAKQAERITANLLNGGLKLRQWEKSMGERIKQMHIQSYLLGRGGILQYDRKADKAVLDGIVKREFKYLRGFSEDIKAGELTPGRIRARAKLYAAAAWKTREKGKAIAHQKAGFNFEQNIIDRKAENCGGCEYFTYLGVVPIGKISRRDGPGTRECRGNCRCRMKYSRDRPQKR